MEARQATAAGLPPLLPLVTQADPPPPPALTPALGCAHSIFLIDHAWTCRVEHARQQLRQVPGLLLRMANLMGIGFHGELPGAEAEDLVLEEMWRFNQTYQLAHGVSRDSPGSQDPAPGAAAPEVSRLSS